MARTTQTARQSTSGKAPKKQLVSHGGARMPDSGDSNEEGTKKRGLGAVRRNKSAVKASLLKKQSTKKGQDKPASLSKVPTVKTQKSLSKPSLAKAATLKLTKQTSAAKSMSKTLSHAGAKRTSITKQGSKVPLSEKQSTSAPTKRKSVEALSAGGKKKKSDDPFAFTSDDAGTSLMEEEEEKADDVEDEMDKKEPTGKRTPKKRTPSRGRPKKSPAKAEAAVEINPCHFLKGEYLAVRSETDDFYICRACQNVYENTSKIKVYWMEKLAGKEDNYKFEYVEYIHGDFRCIITDVKMVKVERQTYQLPKTELDKIETILKKGIDRQKGIDEDSEEEEVEDTPTKEPSSPRKKKAEKKAKVVSTKAKTKKEVKEKEKKTKAKMVKMTSEERRNPNLLLKGRASVPVLNKDPLLETREVMPFVSSNSYSKLVSRAVNLRDMDLLEKLINDTKRISKINMPYSVGFYKDPVEQAVLIGNLKAAERLMGEIFEKNKEKQKKRASNTNSLIQTQGTGVYNYRSLGIPVIRKLTVSRGSREGNNALMKDETHVSTTNNVRKYVKMALIKGVPLKQLKHLLVAGNEAPDNHVLYDNIYLAVRMGHRKLAAELMQEQQKAAWGMSSFNNLHIDTLKNDGEDLKTFRAVSVRKKPYDNVQITPIHCASINPDPKYLAKLLSVVPEFGIMDGKQRRPIHYAAACEGTGPLEFLLKRGIDPNEVDSMSLTPLHIACETGRVDNVHLLLKKAQKDAQDMAASSAENGEDDDDEIKQEKNVYGVGGVNRPVTKPQNRKYYSYCAIHIATEYGFKDIVEVLLKHGADVNKTLGPSRNKNTPLIVAAYSGQLDICKLLVKNGATVETRDKLKRTALIHAVMSGHAHVASYLLGLGSNPNVADSSGNTAMHYAAAYGWYFCLKLLLDAKADPNVPNDWKVTPLGIAFLKGHVGIADILLEQPGVDINFKDDSGMTLLAIACGSPLEEGIVEQITYLVEKKGADCCIKDVTGNSTLHQLCKNTVKLAGWGRNRTVCPKAVQRCLKIAELLIDNGCEVNDPNDEHETPLMMAVEQANVPLVKLLIEKGSKVSMQINKDNQNILHIMADQCVTNKLSDMIKLFQRCTSAEDLVSMAKEVDNKGYTPLLKACYNYKNWNGDVSVEEDEKTDKGDESDEESEEEDEEPEEEEEPEVEEEEVEEPMNEEGPEEEDEPEEDDEDMDEDNEDDDEGSVASGGTDIIEDQDSQPIAKDLLKEPSMEKTKEDIAREKQLKEIQNFIKALIDICEADVDFPMQKITYTKKQQVPEKEADQYVKDIGLWTPAVMLLDVKAEAKARCVGDGLKVILDYNPDINVKDVYGRTPLLTAIALGKKEPFNILIEYGADVNICSGNKLTDGNCSPLYLAVSNSNVEFCKVLLKKGAKVDVRDTRTEDNLIHNAALLKGQIGVDILSLLLSEGADINAVNNKQRTPLHLAVNANSGQSDSSTEVVAYLIDQEADMFARDCRDRLPLHYVFVKIGQFADTSAIDPIELCTTLTNAIETNGIDAVDEFGQTPLHRAALRGASVCCMHLIQRGASINRKDDNGNTPVGMAVFEKHESCSIMLLQKNASVNINVIVPADDEPEVNKNEKPAWKWKPFKEPKPEATEYPLFQCVVYNNWQGLTFMLLDVLDDHNIPYNKTIEAAMTVGKFNLAMTLIRKQKKNPILSQCNEDGRNLFHLLAKSSPGLATDLQKRICGMLDERGINMLAKDRYGCTPMHYAALKNNTTVGSFIFENAAGLNIEEKDNFKRTILAASFWSHHTPVFYLKLLKDKGAKADVLCDYPAIHPMMFGKFPVVDYFEASGNRNRTSPLILSIYKKNFDVVKHLIKNGASLNFCDDNKMTPLMHAVKVNDKHLVKLLLDSSYDMEKALQAEEEAKTKKVALMKKKSSRRLFLLGQNILAQQQEEKKKDKKQAEKHMEVDVKVNGVEADDIDLDQYGTFEKKTNVDLRARDNQGWSAVHHLVSPLEYGTYDNVELLKILYDAGAPIRTTDNAGLTPLDYSLIRGAPNLSKALQKLNGVEKKTWERPTYCGSKLNDGIHWDSSKPDYKQDAEKVLEQLEREVEDEKKEKWMPEVDEQLELEKGAGEVVKDEELDAYYDVLLFKIDVKQGVYGLYNFYKMQIVYQKGKDMYILLNRWGRIGDLGQYQRTPFPKREDVIKEFCKVFRAKTGNPWKKVKEFEQKPNKYRLIEAEERQKGPKLKQIHFDLKSDVPSKLPKYTQDMLKEWMDMTAMDNTLRKYHVDAALMPFGRIKKSALQKAKDILIKLKPLIEAIAAKREAMGTLSPPNMDDYTEDLNKACQLTNDYLHIVPQEGFEYEKVKPIDSEVALKEHWNRIHALLEMELAVKVFAGASSKRQELNPVDYVYRCLGCKIQLMDETEVEAQYLLKYISNTYNKKVEAVFCVAREGEEKRLQECELDNHMLLFHGSSTYNLISILAQGLLVAPPEAPATGYAFGKGIYAADEFTKSESYCHNYGYNAKTRFMLVCQMALGKPNEVLDATFDTNVPSNCNSTVAMSRNSPDPSYDVTLPSGAKIRLGPIKPRPKPTPDPKTGASRRYGLSHNEYIVYDSSQVCLRYIIQFR